MPFSLEEISLKCQAAGYVQAEPGMIPHTVLRFNNQHG